MAECQEIETIASCSRVGRHETGEFLVGQGSHFYLAVDVRLLASPDSSPLSER